MDSISISLGDDILIGQDNGITLDEQTNLVSTDSVMTGPPGPAGFSPIATVTQGTDSATISITDQQGTTTATVHDGYSPSASVTKVGTTSTISITDKNGTTTASVNDGSAGPQGEPGENATIQIGNVRTLNPGSSATVTNTSGSNTNVILDFGIPQGERGIQGVPGIAGTDGVSPVAYVTPITGGARVVIEDEQATTTADIMNGTDGVDGYSPSATVTQSGGVTTISITDKNGTTTESITIPTQTSDLTNDGSDGTSTYVEADDLATVATTGDYSDLLNKPTIPPAQVQSDWNQTNTSAVDYIKNKPNIPSGVTLYPSTGQNTDGAMTQKATTDALADKADTSSLATVATSGDYDDLLNKPTIPSAQVNSDWNAVSGVAEILNKPSLATVATSGAYSDLTGTPSIPSSFSDLTGTISTAQIANNAVTDVKIDLTSFTMTSNVATLNTTYITSGSARWIKLGRMVLLNISDWTITANIPSNSTTLAISNIPKASEYSSYGHYVINAPSRKIRLGFNSDRTSLNFFWASGAAASEMCGQIIYFTDD